MADRKQVIDTWLAAWGAVNSGRYKVVRGFFNPESWSFRADPFVVAVTIASDTVIKRMDPTMHQGLPQPMTIETIVLGQVAPPAAVANVEYLLSDAELVQFTDDLTAVIDAALAAVDANNRPILQETAEDDLQEIYDEEAHLVGIRYTLTILY